MADQQQHSGGHYSGANPVPTIKKFVESLDRDKKSRDAKLDEDLLKNKNSDVQAHVPDKKDTKSSNQQSVTDPTTGNQVVIENASKSAYEELENPKLSVPNANLGRSTTVKTEANQKNPEYKHKQDITAPPDPVEPGSTSDVPIHGEKTNILFHPTPSVSYEPTFAALEKQATMVCIGVFLAVCVLGKMFGGKLIGLVPLAMCVTSGIFLWMKEVVRSGREVEWQSEKERGETVSLATLQTWRNYC